jgi:hypothetical protein
VESPEVEFVSIVTGRHLDTGCASLVLQVDTDQIMAHCSNDRLALGPIYTAQPRNRAEGVVHKALPWAANIVAILSSDGTEKEQDADADEVFHDEEAGKDSDSTVR